MAVESIIQRILTSRRDLTYEQVARMIEEREKAGKGYFTTESVAQIVASELRVEIPRKDLRSEISIKNLVSGLDDVTITGRVIYVSPSQSFTRSVGAAAFVRRLVIADASGVLPVVLWDERAKDAEDKNVGVGDIVSFSHGYVREGPDGKTQLNLGTRGEIKILTADEPEDRYPRIEKFIRKIGEIDGKSNRVNVTGIVQHLSLESSFKRKDGRDGKMRRLWLEDSTGGIEVVFWNEKVEQIKTLEEGQCLQITNARVRNRLDAQLQLHVEETSIVEVKTEVLRDPRLHSNARA